MNGNQAGQGPLHLSLYRDMRMAVVQKQKPLSATASQCCLRCQKMSLCATGFQCLRGITPDCAGDCSKAPLIATAYVACNLGLNISLLALLRQAGDNALLVHGLLECRQHALPDLSLIHMHMFGGCKGLHLSMLAHQSTRQFSMRWAQYQYMPCWTMSLQIQRPL
jgi:hypothetical protein